MELTPQQEKVVDICAERIRNEGRGQQGLIIWQVCRDYKLDTKPIAQALQKRGTAVKRGAKMKEFVEVTVDETLHETDEAVLFDLGEDEGQWIPKSIMEDYPDEGESGTAMVQRWFAEQESLI